jgi:hypothetical protein
MTRANRSGVAEIPNPMPASVRIDELAREVGEHLPLAKAEFTVLRQEWLLADLFSTSEPTREIIAHLADLRRAVARAQQRKGGP